jgi:glucose/arabinose dehydrogenase
MSRRRWIFVVVAAVLLVGCVAVFRFVLGQANFRPSIGEGGVAEVTVPPGFEVAVFAEGLNGPRFIAFGPDGVLYAADRGNGRIVALPDEDGDGTADEIREFATGLNRPHSLVYHQGAWYIGVQNGVVRLVDEDGDGTADMQEQVVSLPSDGSHTTKTVEFLPDGRMVVSVGSTCNVCEEDDPRRAAVLVYDDENGTGESIFATGLRNAVGLAVHPATGELWATNNGRDLMGDDLPPENVYIVREGLDYGWPRCHSGDVIDPDFGGPDACAGVEPPVTEMQAHSAPLGMVFYTGQDAENPFPQEYWGDLFVALHGSWNRSVPTGYKVVRLPLDGSEPSGLVVDFAVGWLDEETDEASGRPVGLAVGPDGTLYVSDDKGGFVYRIYYEGG